MNRAALLPLVILGLAGCALPLPDRMGSSPVLPATPIGTSEDIAGGVMLLGGVGLTASTAACAAECPAPYHTVVPVVVIAGALLAAGYVLYSVGQGRGLR